MYDSLLLCNKILLYKNNQFIIQNNQAIGIVKGVIDWIGPASPELQAKNIYNFKNHLLCPGLVNTHTHLPMSLFRGLADNLNLNDWLQNYIFPLEEALLTEDAIRLGTQLSLIELIRSGVTCCYDMYFYNKAIAETLDTCGLRGIVSIAIPSIKKDKQSWQQKIEQLSSQFKNHNRITIGLAPHAPYTVNPKTLSEIGDYSKSHNIPLVIHVSESLHELQHIQKTYGKTPIEHLHDLALTGDLSLFVHCVQATEKDLDIMAQSKTALSYNPASNMKLSNGIAPIGLALQKGVTVGLGTDSSASNNNLNFFKEMGIGARLQALKYGDKSLTAQSMLQMASIEAAKSMGLQKDIGSLDVGKRADIIAIDLNHAAFYPSYKLISNMVYASTGNEVCFVMCEGKVLMDNYQLQTIDEQKVFKESKLFACKVQDFLS